MSSIGHGNPRAAYDFYQRIKQVVQVAVPAQGACSRGLSDMSAVRIEQEVAAPLRGKMHDECVMDAPVNLCPTVRSGFGHAVSLQRTTKPASKCKTTHYIARRSALFSLEFMVERRRIELPTFALRMRFRSAQSHLIKVLDSEELFSDGPKPFKINLLQKIRSRIQFR
ncbi:hypothetical protein [Burkholderia anthina]|uniref:hypothetical protein n=1 Tax=Burkholderia anthina TaxID=179879 RepID=UPI0037BFB2BC